MARIELQHIVTANERLRALHTHLSEQTFEHDGDRVKAMCDILDIDIDAYSIISDYAWNVLEQNITEGRARSGLSVAIWFSILAADEAQQ